MTQKSRKAAPGRPRPAVDWEKVEGDYRAGVKTNYAIADEHGISEALVRKNAKKYGWTRDLTDKIKAAMRAAISLPGGRDLAPLPEAEIVEIAAGLQVKIIHRHQDQLSRLSRAADTLTRQLEPLLNDPMLLVPNLAIVEKLTTVTASLIKLERQAFNIDAEGGTDEGSKVLKIERVIIDVAHSDSAGFSPAT